jgi:hypothetical protein
VQGASMATQAAPPTPSVMDDVSHAALPGWYANFQKSFGLSFLIICSGYLMGKLATLGWVKDLQDPLGWGWFNGAGVVFFFLGGLVIAGIGLTCSVAFVRSITVRPRQPFLAFFTLVGMFVFFGIEVWASLSERSDNLVATRADLAVLAALGFKGVPPLSPTVVVVSLMFPLGSLYYGFVQQGKMRKSAAELAEDQLNYAQEAEAEKHKADMAALKARTRKAQAQGLAGMLRAGVQAATHDDEAPGEAAASTPDPQ